MDNNREKIVALLKDITGSDDENKIYLLVDRFVREIEEKLEPYHSGSFTHGRLVRK